VNRIRLLPETVANQIAAGEVVERPASVVKELVENAVDAGARRVVVEIERGGRSLVRVSDDGWGMSRDDALLCLERHATSKIASAGDLEAVRTMGFRGEALPSIASVSRFTLTTRERDESVAEGTRVVVHGGKLLDVGTAGHAPGTTIEVRQLFYNLPARRKFLRTEETERSHILHYLTLAVLGYPEVGLTLRQDQRVIWQMPPVPAGRDPLAGLRERMRLLLGADLALLPVGEEFNLEDAAEAEAEGEWDAETTGSLRELPPAGSARLRVWGFIGAPGVSRATRQDQHLFVNRRPIESRALNYALWEGYHTALMKGRYPVCCLFLEIDPAAVDVNVHPAKREVRFRQEHAVRRCVSEAVRRVIRRFHQADSAAVDRPAPGSAGAPPSGVPREPNLALPTASIVGPVSTRGAEMSGEDNVGPEPESGVSPAGRADRSAEPFVRPEAEPALLRLGGAMPTGEVGVTAGRIGVPGVSCAGGGVGGATSSPGRSGSGPAGTAVGSSPGASAVPLLQVPLRLVGVLGNLYVLFESDRGLVFMDQHAAHERVLFEQMLNRLESEPAASQRLLLPETVELSVRDSQFIRENLDVLGRLGVGLSEFGDRTFLLDAVPPYVKLADSRRFVRDLVDELAASGRQVNALRLGEHLVATTVCRHAVKAHDPLTPAELEQLVADLRRCAMPYTCPHGRPTLIEMGFGELERKFGRVV
jgi:DNA mismatch repair protein MutL